MSVVKQLSSVRVVTSPLQLPLLEKQHKLTSSQVERYCRQVILPDFRQESTLTEALKNVDEAQRNRVLERLNAHAKESQKVVKVRDAMKNDYSDVGAIFAYKDFPPGHMPGKALTRSDSKV